MKAKDQSCNAFWRNNSGLFCWGLCNSFFEKVILFCSQSLDRVRAGSGFGGDEAAQNGQHSC